MNKKSNAQTELSYYGLYLLNYLQANKFKQAADAAFVQNRADEAAAVYERARLEGYPADGAHELAMNTLVEGLHYSKYNILREVVESEFYTEIPEGKRDAFTMKLLPLVDNVFSIYNLSDEHFAYSSERDLLHSELTGAVILYLEAYGI